MKLELNGLEVNCVIGERPEERTRTQRLRVDVVMDVDESASTSDSLRDVVDYAKLASKIRAALEWARCRMIERAARVAYDACMLDSRVNAASVKITKFGAIPFLESASVTYEGSR